MAERINSIQDTKSSNNKFPVIESIESYVAINQDVFNTLLREYAGEVDRMRLNSVNFLYNSFGNRRSNNIQGVDLALEISRLK